MKTVIHKADEKFIEEAGMIIKNGGLVAFPTETVYGLGANALDENASSKIYDAKGRPSDNPLIVHIADIEALEKIVETVPKKAKILADKFWPGPLTMIFRKRDCVPYKTSGGLDTVAVRMPDNKIAIELIRKSGGYIAAPSANTSGRPSPTTARHVLDDMDGKIDAIIDGGAVGIGIESTIVDLSEDIPVILRPGYISREMISDLIGEVKIDPAILNMADNGFKPKSPGMKYKHYSPKADILIIEGDNDKVISKINELVEEKTRQNKICGVISSTENIEYYKGGIVKDIGSKTKEEQIAHNLYGVFREFDDETVDYIFSESFKTPKMGMAIMNRLLKAAGYNIIKV